MRADLSIPKSQDANYSMSSDEEMFQECESGFDLDTTPTNVEPSTMAPAHSSNIDHNIFDKTINFSTIAANLTAGLMASITSNSTISEKNDTLYKTSVVDHPTSVSETLSPQLNQTIEMAECDPINECAPRPNLADNMVNTNVDSQPELQRQAISMNVTQDLNGTVELNQTIENTTNGDATNDEPIDGISPPMNVTIDGAKESTEPDSSINEVTSSAEDVAQMAQFELQNQITPINVTQDFSDLPTTATELNQTTDLPETNEHNATSLVQLNRSLANETFGKDGSDGIPSQMNVTIDVPMEICARNSPMIGLRSSDRYSPLQNQTRNQTVQMEITQGVTGSISMAEINMDPSTPKDKISSQMNVTIDAPEENAEPKSMANEIPILNQTIDLSYSKGNMGTSPIVLNETFAKNDSPAALDITRNVNNDLLSSTRRSIDAISTISTLPSSKMDETIIVDNKLPCMNTSYIVASKSTPMEVKPDSVDKDFMVTHRVDAFKMPAAPANASNPFESKQKIQDFDISDDEFNAPGCKFFLLLFIMFIFTLIEFCYFLFNLLHFHFEFCFKNIQY